MPSHEQEIFIVLAQDETQMQPTYFVSCFGFSPRRCFTTEGSKGLPMRAAIPMNCLPWSRSTIRAISPPFLTAKPDNWRQVSFGREWTFVISQLKSCPISGPPRLLTKRRSNVLGFIVHPARLYVTWWNAYCRSSPHRGMTNA